MLLLNTCCAPCALPIMDYLQQQNEPTAWLFSGPNLSPPDEYQKRVEATQKAAAAYGVTLYLDDDAHENWLQNLQTRLEQPLNIYPENSGRCLVCFEYRLDRTAKFAKENGFSSFATTLSVSQHKDTSFINNHGLILASRFGLEYVTFPLDPAAAHQKGVKLSKELGLYRQKYCGCEFSVR